MILEYFEELDNSTLSPISELEFKSLISSGRMSSILVSENIVKNIIRSTGNTDEYIKELSDAEIADREGLKLAQARKYLLETDFKALNNSLSAEQSRLRSKAKSVLDGSYREPDSDLFDI